jgi:dTDP-4-amino-4,6-dideoxygalactose transaminase
VEEIERIATKHGLKVIYDAAHCFGVEYLGRSIFDYGDISTCSFHATKLFHTGEGGAVFCNDAELIHKIFYSHNFGHDGPLAFHGLGINGKISELQAAMGLSVLPHMNEILGGRKRVVEQYNASLKFNKISKLKIREITTWNYSYYPVVFEVEEVMFSVQKNLNALDIFPRRYFYPSLNTIPYVKNIPMAVSESIANRVLCLPLYADLSEIEIALIVNTINETIC